MTTTTTTRCPDWCTADHDGEAATLRARHDAEGLDYSFDPATYVIPHRSGDLTHTDSDGITRGARLEHDADGLTVVLFELDPSDPDSVRDLRDLPPADAINLARIILRLSQQAMEAEAMAAHA